MKTLEEAVDKASLLEFPIKEWYRSYDYSREEITAARDGFKRGYKLAQERSYSEEDMKKAIDFMPYHLEYGNIVARKSDKDIENFIEQFKKK